MYEIKAFILITPKTKFTIPKSKKSFVIFGRDKLKLT